MKVVESSMNVLQAAKIRIRNVFANGCKIYLSFSSGKDSLCMANLVYEMILSGELDPKQLTVTFIDEEGLYPSMVDAAHRWRRNFLYLCRTWSSPSCMTLQWLKLRSTRPTAGRSSRSVLKRYCDGGTLP